MNKIIVNKSSDYWRNSYDKISSIFNKVENPCVFYNHGYSPAYTQCVNQEWIHQSSLYHHMLIGIETKDKKILEVGCGRGGGISYLKTYSFKQMHACDVSLENINYCLNNHDSEIVFQVADALSLPYQDNYFDIVLNVESSHCYDGVDKFLSEVDRVMKPNGIFLYTDCDVSIESYLPRDRCMFKYIYREDITHNVLDACKKDLQKFSNIKETTEYDKQYKDLMLYAARSSVDKYYNSVYKTNYIKYVCSNDKTNINKVINYETEMG
jgi:ubiquinone/menaquinone biosynthesis C-methylase UbiE